ncbi:leucine rich repeat containing protein 47 [Trichuris trichiura]|uniref:Leucine rich repeat containing protein 47 n=1 Tax=Trichuris trichiura TaxID=36087 RepID=A0A077Z174_TRITR|nr:leucine rich repeat containing protein 47 [Trichuris trichiura]
MNSCATFWPELAQLLKEERHELKVTGSELNSRLEKCGGLPVELFKLPSLNFVELSHSSLSHMPEDIGEMSHLTNLVLRGNSLNSLPDTIGSLASLKYLDVSRNALTELPASIVQCGQLQTLNLSNNRLTALPEGMNNMTWLIHVDASHNELKSIPESLCSSALTHFTELILKHNQIEGLPNAIGQLISLKLLDLSENSIKSVPFELCDCVKLRDLNLSSNPLSDRRLLKLTKEKNSKTLLDYLRQKRPQSHDSTGKISKTAKVGKQSTGGEVNETEQAGNVIVVETSNADHRIRWSSEVADVRPYIICCIVKGLNFTDESSLKAFLKMQTKLHDTVCQKRVAGTIATHDLKLVQFPLLYTALPRDEISHTYLLCITYGGFKPGKLYMRAQICQPSQFLLGQVDLKSSYSAPNVDELNSFIGVVVRILVPLNRMTEVTAVRLVEILTEEAEAFRKEKKRNVYSGIHQYIYLVKNREKYACLLDAEQTVISLPPITNASKTKVSLTTTDVLVEVTSSESFATCKRIMELFIAYLLIHLTNHQAKKGEDKCGVKITLEQAKVWTADDSSLKSAYPTVNDLHDLNADVVRPNREQ